MAPTERSRRAFALVLVALGVALAVAGVGAAFAYQSTLTDAPAATPAAASAAGQGGLALDARLDVSLLGLDVQRDLHADPPAARDAALPGLSVRRTLGLDDVDAPVDAPLDARLDLALASGSHLDRDAGGATGTTTQASQAAVLGPAPHAAALAAAALAGVGVVAYFWASIKTWLTKALILPLIPLYAHVTRAEVFDNQVRERIFASIRETPGVSASEISRATNVSWGTTIYHLDVLEQTRMVVSMRDGRYRRYFQNGATLDADKKVVSILRNTKTAEVVQTVRATPGATQKELAEALGLSPQALHWHLARLVKAGLVEKRRDGRTVRHFAAA